MPGTHWRRPVRRPTGDRVECLVSGRSTHAQDPVALGATGSCHVRATMAGMQRPTAGWTRPISIGLFGAALIALLVGCTTASPSTTAAAPTGSQAPASGTPAPTPGASADATPGPTKPGQTDTDWERIWDGLPSSFPAYPGAHPTETGAGPASATLDAGTAQAAAVNAFYRTAFASIGYGIVSSDGPREDGSYELIVGGQAACDIRVTAGPLGGSTIITIMYGALCPFT